MNTVKLTPMMEQYLLVKEEYPDTLVFFRMGDFFELFFEDAEIAARELQITLTSRNPGADNPVPMCGMIGRVRSHIGDKSSLKIGRAHV